MIDRHRLGAWRALRQRYVAVWRAAWRQRRALDTQLLREHEAAYLPAALSLQARPVSPTARRTAAVLIALVALLLLWSLFGHVDIIVNAAGKIIPSGRIKTIAAVEVASVKALHVAEGQRVKAGQLLVELDTSASDAERDKAQGDHDAAVLESARALALIAALTDGKPPRLPTPAALQRAGATIGDVQWQMEQQHLSGQYRDYCARRGRFDATIAHLGEALALATRRAADYQALLREHDVAQHAWLEKEQARIELAGQLAEARQQRVALLEEAQRLAYDQLSEGNKLAASTQQDTWRAAAHSKLLNLTAPVDGTVQQLTVHTVGGVVPAAQALMQIVPDARAVEVEAELENRDVGFVREGQPAAVKVTAFDYTKYGTVPAKVTHVAHDAVQNEKKELVYTVKVTLSDTALGIDGRRMALAPGMAVEVGIKTGERRLIEYALSPLLRHQREALHER
ncbi:HlyD family type I secretion periplasmic adaptor subunit [Janthinobacterium sp. RB2R34]|uniref:HlyD family type I secretion periplasmic adaptor subunit n=1 Tax=Janthinobacterium sp. RB2R34 TaxID=3424193 RepID=UPI003F25D6CA